MDTKELQGQLEALKTSLEGKAEAEVKTAMDAFKVDMEKSFDNFSTKEDLTKAQTELNDGIKAVQDHLDKLDVRMQKQTPKDAKTRDIIKDLIVDNFDAFSQVIRKGRVMVEDEKAAGVMTLSASLTGDQPRTFSNSPIGLPNQILNFSDLISTINIGNGTYTFPRFAAGEGTPATQTEGSDKTLMDLDVAMIDVNPDFIAGYCNYSKKMANNLPFLESFLPGELRRRYFDGENSVFNTALAAAATASSQVITDKNKIEMLLNEVATLEGSNYRPNGIVVTPADYWAILATEKSTGAGYGVPQIVTLDNGQLRVNGIPLFRANWLAANKYYVADWSYIKKVQREGVSVEFSTEDEDNFRKNQITARVEAQVAVAIEQPAAVIYGDFTAT